MSTFNMDLLCVSCKTTEVEHPAHEAASKAENAAIRRGESDFQGVGLPADLVHTPEDT